MAVSNHFKILLACQRKTMQIFPKPRRCLLLGTASVSRWRSSSSQRGRAVGEPMAPDGEPIKRRPSMLSKALRGSQLRILANVYPSFGLPGTRVLPNHLGAKGTPSAFLRMTCAPIGAPHTLPEDRWSQEEATRQVGAALVLVTQVCACDGGRVAVKNHPYHPCAHTPHTHTHVRKSVPT